MTAHMRDVSLGSSPTDPVDAVRSLTEQIRAECGDIDSTRALPAAIVRALQEAGVFRLMAPVEIGGDEVDPVTFFDVVEAASYADGSVGWCVMIGGCYATFGGMLPPEAEPAPSTATSHDLSRRLPARRGRRRSRWRLPSHRAVAVGQRFQPRQLVHRLDVSSSVTASRSSARRVLR